MSHEALCGGGAAYQEIEQQTSKIANFIQTARRAAVPITLAAGLLVGAACTPGPESAPVGSSTTTEADGGRGGETGGYPDADAYDCSSSYGTYSWCKPGDDWISPRGYGYRNCTDWVAWKVQQLIGRGIPGLGDAKTWDDRAGAHGFQVDGSPEPGDAAVKNSGNWGHVAYVESVNADGSVNVSEYNQAGTGNFGRRDRQRFDAYIDFNGSNNPAPVNPGSGETPSRAGLVAGEPTAVVRGPATMDVFYRDPQGNLANAGWGGGQGWSGPNSRSGGMASDPVAISRYPLSMDVFYRDGANNLQNVGWNSANNGWGPPQVRVTDGSVAGDPSAIFRSPESMDVFFRNRNGNLVNIGWTALRGWSDAQTLVADGSVAGNPVAVKRHEQAMEVFYRDTRGNLSSVGWDANIGWMSPQTRATGMKGDPAAISRSSLTMDAFYRTSNNSLGNAGWDAYHGWNTQILANGGVNSDPAAVARAESDMNVVYVDSGGNLMERGWNSGLGWMALGVKASGVNGNPTIISRTYNDMDIFVRGNNGELVNPGWNGNWMLTVPVR